MHALDHCRGYRVESAGGRVGIVESALPWMDAVEVRAGRAGRRILLVSLDQIALVDPHERRIVLRGRPHLLGSRADAPSLLTGAAA